jgi:hypothetical protein
MLSLQIIHFKFIYFENDIVADLVNTDDTLNTIQADTTTLHYRVFVICLELSAWRSHVFY